MPTTTVDTTFGSLLKQLRRRAGLTQGELAALVGFSISQISLLEKNKRLPDLAMVREKFAPVLGLESDLRLQQRLLELAAQMRGGQVTVTRSVARSVSTTVHEEVIERSGALPAALTPLLGREREINSATQRLMDTPGRLLTVVGPPGVGKTRLAQAIAEHLQALFADGALIVDLSAISDPAHLGGTMLVALGIHESSNKLPLHRLIEHLRRSERLIVLDNFEQLLTLSSYEAGDTSATRTLFTLLGECPKLRLLITSREPLRLRAEQRFKVQPLEVAAAVELFLQRAQWVDPEMEPSPAALAAITEICLRLDCLPLAIELLAARIDLLSPQAMLARLKDRSLDLLRDGPSDLPPQHRTLRSAIQRSYELLAEDEQVLFRLLGVFVGTFDLAAVEQLYPHRSAADGLQSLIAKSLVKTGKGVGDERRYQLLETLRDYAIEQLHANDEEPMARHRHAYYFQHVAEVFAAASLASGSAHLSVQLVHEHDNLRAALQWQIDHDPQAAQQFVGTMRRFWYTHGHLAEGQQWAEKALAASEAETVERAAALLALGQMMLNRGMSGEAQKVLSQALAIFEAANALEQIAHTQIELGWAVYLSHQPNASLVHFRRALSMAALLDNGAIKAHALTSLTHVMVFEGSYTEELKHYIEESITLCQQLGDVDNASHALLNLSAFYTQTGNYSAAIQTLQSGEESAAASANLATLGWVYATLAELSLITGDLPAVHPLLDKASQLFQVSSNHDGITMIHHHRGELARKEGHWQEARLAFEESQRLALSTQNERVIARCLMGLGRIALATGQNEEASQLMGAAWIKLSTQPAFLAPAIVNDYQLAFLTIEGDK